MSKLNKIVNKETFTINWRYAIGEVILIVIGILIALWINELAQNQQDRQLEKQYLNALNADLKNDVIYYDSTYHANDRRINDAYAVMQILDGEAPFPPDSLAFLKQLLSTMSLEAGDRPPNVWNELQATGNLRLLRNRKLVDRLFEYYSLRESNQENNSQYFEPVIRANRELVDEIFPLQTFQELTARRIQTVPPPAVFTTYLHNPEVKKNWKKLIVRATLQNARIKLFKNRAEQLLYHIENQVK